MRGLDYSGLAAMAAVCDTGSFDRAGERLRLTPSAISHRVKALEERIGAPLVVRGQPCVATEIGERLRRHHERVALLEWALRQSLPERLNMIDGVDRPRVRVVVNADSLASWCLDALARFAGDDGPLLEILTDDESVTVDWLAGGRADAAITASADASTGARVYPLGALRYRATASPAFVVRHALDDGTREAYQRAPCLNFDRKDGLQQAWLRNRFTDPPEPPIHWLPSSQAFVEAAVLGLGWGLNPEPLVQEHLASGRLVELPFAEPVDVPLYWQVNRLSADLLSGLTDCVHAAARSVLLPHT